MGIFGLGLIALVGLVLVLTGLPAFAVLILAAVIGASCAVVIGGVPGPCSGPCPGALSICSRAICCRPYPSMS
jgi:hypothetical protein